MRGPKEQEGHRVNKEFFQRPGAKLPRDNDQVSRYIDEGNPNTQPVQTSVGTGA